MAEVLGAGEEGVGERGDRKVAVPGAGDAARVSDTDAGEGASATWSVDVDVVRTLPSSFSHQSAVMLPRAAPRPAKRRAAECSPSVPKPGRP